MNSGSRALRKNHFYHNLHLFRPLEVLREARWIRPLAAAPLPREDLVEARQEGGAERGGQRRQAHCHARLRASGIKKQTGAMSE